MKAATIFTLMASFVRTSAEFLIMTIIGLTVLPNAPNFPFLTFIQTNASWVLLCSVVLLYVASATVVQAQEKLFLETYTKIQYDFALSVLEHPEGRRNSTIAIQQAGMALNTEGAVVYATRYSQFVASLAGLAVLLAGVLSISRPLFALNLILISILLLTLTPIRSRIGSTSKQRVSDSSRGSSIFSDLLTLQPEIQQRMPIIARQIYYPTISEEARSSSKIFVLSQVTLAIFTSVILTAGALFALATQAEWISLSGTTAASLLATLRSLLYSQGVADWLAVRKKFRATVEEIGTRSHVEADSVSSAEIVTSTRQCRVVPADYVDPHDWDDSAPPLVFVKGGFIEVSEQRRSFRLEVPELLVRRGSVVSLLAPSGSGKSTLLMALAGVLQFSGGDVALPSKAVGYVPQNADLLRLSVRENFLLHHASITDEEIWTYLRIVGLNTLISTWEDGLDTHIGTSRFTLSSGQVQRLALARVFSTEPEMLVLDEPVANLDALSARSILAWLQKNRSSMAIVVASHQPLAPHLYVDTEYRIESADNH